MTLCKHRNDDGFTLIELAVAFAVITALVSISLTSFLGMRKDAIVAGLISDVKNAGSTIQGKIILSDDPGVVPTNLSFFVSAPENRLSLKVIESPKGSFCVIGTTTDYEDVSIYYASESGGMTHNPSDCGSPGDSTNGNTESNDGSTVTPIPVYVKDEEGESILVGGEPEGEVAPPASPSPSPTPTETSIPTDEPSNSPSPEPTEPDSSAPINGMPAEGPEDETTPTSSPTPAPTQTATPTSPSPSPTPTPSPTTQPVSPIESILEPLLPPLPPIPPAIQQNNYPQYGPQMATYIPPTAIAIIETPVPSTICKSLIQENIRAEANFYSRIKYQNLVSIMARLQSGNHDLVDILKSTPEGQRVIASRNAISISTGCNEFVIKKKSVAKYYDGAYTEEQLAYIHFINNLTIHSADSNAYVHAYQKLYTRVYGVTI